MQPPARGALLLAALCAVRGAAVRSHPGRRAASASQVAVERSRVEPNLRPVEDKAMYGPPHPADYPTDVQPKPDKEAPHSMKLQDAKTYHDDYTKDEDSDGGAWKKQEHYDTLRMNLKDQEKEVEAAQHKAKEEVGQELEVAKKGQAAQEKALAAEKTAAAAEETHKVKEKEQAAAEKEKEMHAKEAQAAKEAKEFEDCQHKLQTAHTDLEKAKQEAAASREAAAEAESATAAETAKVQAAAKEEGELEAQVKQEQAEKEQAEAELAKEEKELSKMKSDLKAATAKIEEGEPAHSAANALVLPFAALCGAFLLAA